MKTKKLLLTAILAGLTLTGFAQTWDCGSPNAADVTATLGSDGTLTISGTGKMADYSPASPALWYDVRQGITNVSIGSNVTGIGSYAFAGCENLASLVVPDNVTSIGYGVLQGCSNLAELTLPFVGKSTTATGNDAVLYYLFSPSTFTEDFEGGNGETLPGWTVVNGSQTNKWYVGTATANGGTRSIYVSNNAADNSYSITSTSVVHFYRDFNLNSTAENPATITFDWKGQGEGTSTLYDYLAVYVVETSVTPVAGSLPGGTPLVRLNLGDASWKQQTITLPAMTGDKRVIFTWRNDNSQGTQPPVAIDNITVTTTTTNPDVLPASLKITLTSPCTAIADGACKNFSALVEVVLPESLTTIGANAFAGCSGLTKITNHAVAPQTIDASVFEGVDKTACTLYVPDVSSMAAYSAADVWKEFTRIVPMVLQPVDAELVSILSPSSGFNLTATEEVKVLIRNLGANPLTGFNLKLELNGAEAATETFTGSIPSLGEAEYAFTTKLNLSAAGEYQIKATIITAGDATPDNNSKTKTVEVFSVNCNTPLASGETGALFWLLCGDGTLTIAGTGAMADYSSVSPAPWYDLRQQITTVSIGNNVTGIGSSAFAGCENLASLIIPANVTSIGGGVLSGCSNLAELTLPFVGKSASATGSEAILNYLFDESTSLFTEDFESGDGETLPGWTVVNGSQTNKWYVGTATANGGTRSIYVSNNAADNSYSITSTSVVHFYRDFNLNSTAENPATITFDWKGQGEGTSTLYDYLAVYVVETSVTPVAGSLPGGTPLVRLNLGGASWKQQTITLPAMTGDKRVIFTWSNDYSQGTQPPIAVDNVTVKIVSPLDVLAPSLKKITLTAPCTAIATNAFNGFSALEEVVLPESLTTIGANAFAGCSGLTKITNHAVAPQTIDASVFEGVDKTACTLYVPDVSSMAAYSAADVWKEFTRIVPMVLQPVDAELVSILSPSSGFNLTATEEVKVLIRNWGANPLTGFNLKLELNGAEAATEIFTGSIPSLGEAEYAFTTKLNLSAAGEYQIKATIITAGDATPDNNSQTKMMRVALIGCDTPVSSGVEGTLIWALCGDSVLTVAGTGNVPFLGWYSLWNPLAGDIHKIVVEDGITSIGDSAFMSCAYIVDLSIGNTVRTIGVRAFYHCTAPFVILPESLQKIGDYAFAEGAATHISIPESVTEIGASAFEKNTGLQDVTVSWNSPLELNYDSDPFAGIDKSLVTLHVPVGTIAAYQAANVWMDFNIVDDGLKFGSDCFLSNLTVSAGKLTPTFDRYRTAYRVTVPLSVESIALTAAPENESAVVTGDGLKDLNTGENTFEIMVTTAEGSLAYTVIVLRTATDYFLESADGREIETGATSIISPVTGSKINIIDRYEQDYILTTGSFSGELPLHFDIGNGQYTCDKTFNVSANSIYRFTLVLDIGYNNTTRALIVTTHFDAYGRPSYVTLSYNRLSKNVIASENNEVILTEAISLVGDFIRSGSISDITFIESGNFTGMEELPATAAIRIFPNPAVDHVTIQGATAGSTVTVTDLSGSTVYKSVMASDNETVNVSAWAKGIYLVRLQKGNVQTVGKLVKK